MAETEVNDASKHSKMAKREEMSTKSKPKIPVFSVVEKGSVLKFLSGLRGETQEDEAILIGTRPDCDIVMDHPSIRLIHLKIRPKPSAWRHLCSVQGILISGTSIKQNVRVHPKEGDLIKLGASSEDYRFHWLSTNEAFEMETQLPPMFEEKDQSNLDQNKEQVCSKSETIIPKSGGPPAVVIRAAGAPPLHLQDVAKPPVVVQAAGAPPLHLQDVTTPPVVVQAAGAPPLHLQDVTTPSSSWSSAT